MLTVKRLPKKIKKATVTSNKITTLTEPATKPVEPEKRKAAEDDRLIKSLQETNYRRMQMIAELLNRNYLTPEEINTTHMALLKLQGKYAILTSS